MCLKLQGCVSSMLVKSVAQSAEKFLDQFKANFTLLMVFFVFFFKSLESNLAPYTQIFHVCLHFVLYQSLPDQDEKPVTCISRGKDAKTV